MSSPLRYCQRCGTRLAGDNQGTACGPCGRYQVGSLTASDPPQVPAEFWQVDLIRDSLAGRHMGHFLRAYREHSFHGSRGIPQEVMARWLDLSQTQLSRIETGRPVSDLRRLTEWARLYRIPRALLWFDIGPQQAGSADGNDEVLTEPESELFPAQAMPESVIWTPENSEAEVTTLPQKYRSRRARLTALSRHLRADGRTWGQIAHHIRETEQVNRRVAMRLAHGLTQTQVAQPWNERWPSDPATPGLTDKNISYWETWPQSGHEPSLKTLKRLAQLYQCDVGDLIDDGSYSHLDECQHRDSTTPTALDVHPVKASDHARPTLLRSLITERHWQRYGTFQAQFRRAARELAEQDNDPSLAKLTVSSRQWERWYAGSVKTEPHPDACRVLEHLFGYPVKELLASPETIDCRDSTTRFDVLTLSPVPALPVPSLAPDPDLYERITRATEDGGVVDHAVITWLMRCLAEHRLVEDEVGAGPLVEVVRAQLSTVVRMARQARSSHTHSLVDLAAQYAQFMAWLCNDSGNKAAALAWYDRAHDWASETSDANMAATTLSMKAHLAWSVGDGNRCLRLAESALWHPERTSLGVQGMAKQMVARGYALNGDSDNAHRTLDDAHNIVMRAASRQEDEPAWMYFYGDTWLTAQRGMIVTELAEHGKTDPRLAVALLEKALADLPDSYRRDRAWYGTMLSRAHAAARNYDAAAGTGLKFAADATAVNRYAITELEQLVASLSRQGVREADDLSDALISR